MKEIEKEMLKEAMEIIDDYLNAGGKEKRMLAHNKAKSIYQKYYGVKYKNREER